MSATASVLTRPTTAALALSLGYGAWRLTWALGGRWGYTACDRTEPGGLSAHEAATACGAAAGAGPSALASWLVVGLCLVTAALVLGVGRGSRVAVAGLWAVAALLLVACFPLHLAFEVPAGLAGHVTDWRDVVHRLVLLAGALALAACARGGRCRHPRPVEAGPAPSWLGRAGRAVVLVPLVGWAVPHALWMSGLAVGIDPDVVRDLAETGATTRWSLVVVPVLGGLLARGLARPWGRWLPAWVPLVGGRRVPRTPVLVAAGTVALALVAYGVIGVGLMGRDLATGATTPGFLLDSWLVVVTEVLFVVWGSVVGLLALGYARLTACPRCRGSERYCTSRQNGWPAGSAST